MNEETLLALDLNQWGDTEAIEHVPPPLAIPAEKEARRVHFLSRARARRAIVPAVGWPPSREIPHGTETF